MEKSKQKANTTNLSPRLVNNWKDARAVSSYRLGFSVTEACPLRCSHCSVSAAPNLGATTYKEVFAEKVISELPGLKKIGISFIDFTGGEPTLAKKFVIPVSQSASELGISTGIVTAANWAGSSKSARHTIEKFRYIDNWDISTDIYHLPFVSIEMIRIAFEELRAIGKTPIIRIAHHEPISYEEAKLIDEVYTFAGERMGFQAIGPVGRAENIVMATPATKATFDQSECPSTGPLVRSSGIVAPCCAPLSNEKIDHPLLLGNAFTDSLCGIVTKWRTNPLLQAIRLWGFTPVLKWLFNDKVDYGLIRTKQCDTCVALARSGDLLSKTYEIANRLENRILIAEALKSEFGETWMENELLEIAHRYTRERKPILTTII